MSRRQLDLFGAPPNRWHWEGGPLGARGKSAELCALIRKSGYADLISTMIWRPDQRYAGDHYLRDAEGREHWASVEEVMRYIEAHDPETLLRQSRPANNEHRAPHKDKSNERR